MAGNREKILNASIDLFNQNGTVPTTTNHICGKIKISPGNLYFHFRNREAIVCELFARMTDEVHAAWDPRLKLQPQQFLEASFEVFWRYRFFHREMYHLRRSDPKLSAQWKKHMKHCLQLLSRNYLQWVKAGIMIQERDHWVLRNLCDSILLSSSAYLGFFESPEKPATRRTLNQGIMHVNRVLWPYYSAKYRLTIA